ncbi:hypothetical protein BDV18DRAFT_158698 [Aspergillus unguis]
MAVWNKVKSLFHGPSNPKKNSSSAEHQTKETHADQQPHNHDSEDSEDPCRNLSEVAAPEPVQRLSPEEQARRPSLEKRLSELSRSDHEEDDNYETLSELAAPEPIERLSEREMARRPSLEQSYSRSH